MLGFSSLDVAVAVRSSRSFLFATFSFVETCGYVHKRLLNHFSIWTQTTVWSNLGVEPGRPLVFETVLKRGTPPRIHLARTVAWDAPASPHLQGREFWMNKMDSQNKKTTPQNECVVSGDTVGQSPAQTTEQPKDCTLGVDVSQGWIDACLLPEGKTWHVEMGEETLKKWAEELPDNISLVVMEATGKLEICPAAILSERGFPVAVVNPRPVRDFAKALNLLAKNDKLDAQILARHAKVIAPEARPLPDAAQLELSELLARRRQLVGMRAAETTRKQRMQSRKVQANIQAHITWLETQIKDVEKDLKRLIKDNSVWSERAELLKTMPGVGERTACTLVAELPELGTLNRREVASLTGLAPFVHQSGKWRGKSFCTGGRSAVRRILFMAATTARQHNPVITAFYDRLIAQKKPFHVAMAACIRKMLVILNTMVKKNENWKTCAQKS
jgi:transposase